MKLNLPVYPPVFKGKTVAVLASGPSLTKELADSVKHLPRICARRAVRMAPDADMIIAMDEYPNEGFWDELGDFKGVKICGANDPRTDAIYVPFPAEMFQTDKAVKFIFNNGIAAIRLAVMTGASEILLLGFDPLKRGTFYDDEDQGPNGEVLYEGLDIILQNVIEELRSKGIIIRGIKQLKEI